MPDTRSLAVAPATRSRRRARRSRPASQGQADAGRRGRAATPAWRSFRSSTCCSGCIPNNQRRYENRVAAPLVEAQAQRVRAGGLHHADAATSPAWRRRRRGPVTDSGPAIAPISLHAGVVTNMADDARARAFFEARGRGGPQRRQRAARAADLPRAVRHPGRARPGARPRASRRVRRALSRRGSDATAHLFVLAAIGRGERWRRRPRGAGPGGVRAGLPELRHRRSGSIRTTSGARIGRSCGRMSARAAQAVIRGGCLTSSADLDGLPALAAAAGSVHHHVDSGPAIRADDGRARHRHRHLGRGAGHRLLPRARLPLARRSGRRRWGGGLFIGPFTSQGALDQALEVARKADSSRRTWRRIRDSDGFFGFGLQPRPWH